MPVSVLLIRPRCRRVPTVVPPLGLGYLATALERRGMRAALFDGMCETAGPDGLRRLLDRGSFDVVGVQVYSCDLPEAREILRMVRAVSARSATVVGGPHPSAAPEHALAYLADADYAFRGEAEAGLPRLAALVGSGGSPAPGEIENLVGRDVASGEEASSRPRAVWHPEDLDALGFPAWHLMPPSAYPPFPHGFAVHGFPVGPVVVTRGCPYSCAFCAARSVLGTRVRARSIPHVMEEIRLLKGRYRVREIHIEDDNFTSDPKLVAEFCDSMERERLDLTWSLPNGIRLERLDEPMLARMRRAGCHSFAVGIESGSPRVLERMRKSIDLRELAEKLAAARRLGFRTTGFFMIGYPGETEEDVRATSRLARTLDLARAQFSVFLPLPGTPVFEDLTRAGELAEPVWEEFLTTSGGVYAPAGMSVKTLKRLQRSAFFAFYRRPRKLLGLLREIRSPRHFLYLIRRGLAILG